MKTRQGRKSLKSLKSSKPSNSEKSVSMLKVYSSLITVIVAKELLMLYYDRKRLSLGDCRPGGVYRPEPHLSSPANLVFSFTSDSDKTHPGRKMYATKSPIGRYSEARIDDAEKYGALGFAYKYAGTCGDFIFHEEYGPCLEYFAPAQSDVETVLSAVDKANELFKDMAAREMYCVCPVADNLSMRIKFAGGKLRIDRCFIVNPATIGEMNQTNGQKIPGAFEAHRDLSHLVMLFSLVIDLVKVLGMYPNNFNQAQITRILRKATTAGFDKQTYQAMIRYTENIDRPRGGSREWFLVNTRDGASKKTREIIINECRTALA